MPEREALEKLVSENKIILIDEVQNYPQATVAIKLLHDEFNVKVVATGSSELRHKTNQDFDSQAGRFTEHYCLPFSIAEIKEDSTFPAYDEKVFEKKLLENLQIFGSYPEVYTDESRRVEDKIKLLQNIVDRYVLKDIIDINALKNEKLARDILTKIALQLGSEVSIREIAESLGSNGGTVAKLVLRFLSKIIFLFPYHPSKQIYDRRYRKTESSIFMTLVYETH